MERTKLTKSAFAKLCGATNDTLLWYDKLGLLKPDRTGDNGYRYYTPAQFINYSVISMLKSAGSSLREVKSFMGGRSLPSLLELLEEKERLLSAQIEEMEQMKAYSGEMRRAVRLALDSAYGVPELVRLDETVLAATYMRSMEEWTKEETPESLYIHLKRYAKAKNVCQYPLGSILEMNAFLNARCVEKAVFYELRENCSEAGADIPTDYLYRRPAGRYVRVYHKGSYDAIGETIAVTLRFMQSIGAEMAGDVFEYDLITILLPFECEQDHVFELLIPVNLGGARD